MSCRIARQQHQRVGLPHAEVRPRIDGRVADIHDEVVGGFDGAEPVAGVGGSAHAPDELSTSRTWLKAFTSSLAKPAASTSTDCGSIANVRAPVARTRERSLIGFEPVHRDLRDA